MNYRTQLIALSCDDHKQCALFFDWITLIAGWSEIPLDYPNKVAPEFMRRFCENEVRDDFFKIFCTEVGFCTRGDFTKSNRYKFALNLRRDLKRKGILAVPVASSLFYENEEGEEVENYVLEISVIGANLIDTDKVEWEQIYEFRRDRESRKKLRNFRLFLYGEYSGKPADYIRDDLQRKMENYRAACKKHGFELVEGTICSLLDSKSALGTVTIAATGTLIGDPFITDVALLSGAALEIGKMSLKISSKLREIQSFKDNHELAYIFEAKKRLEKGK